MLEMDEKWGKSSKFLPKKGVFFYLYQVNNDSSLWVDLRR